MFYLIKWQNRYFIHNKISCSKGGCTPDEAVSNYYKSNLIDTEGHLQQEFKRILPILSVHSASEINSKNYPELFI
jgi:hypothetical protein